MSSSCASKWYPFALSLYHSCFPHVINLAVQAIYAALEDGTSLEKQYLLGNIDHVSEAPVDGMCFPEGVTRNSYQHALKSDTVGVARRLIATCRVSGKRREEFANTIIEGNDAHLWRDQDGNVMERKALELLRDCKTRWSSSHVMLDRVLEMLPVCLLWLPLAHSDFVCPRLSRNSFNV